MINQDNGTIVLTLGLVLALGGVVLVLQNDQGRSIDATPNFSTFQDVNTKKTAFFQYLEPKIQAVNSAIAEERTELLRLIEALDTRANLTRKQQRWLRDRAIKYRVPDRDALPDQVLASRLRERIDEIPAALALAQSANESGWGTSRFAVNQNNFFGLWCYTEDCGVRPLAASSETRHQVAGFDSVQGGVQEYMLTLNSHPAYETLRAIRRDLRIASAPVTGDALAAGLIRYSERGEAYVEELRAMIRINGLDDRDS